MDLDKIIAENDDGSGKFDAATVKKIVTAALSATELAKLGELLDTATRLEGMAMQAATNSSKQASATAETCERLEGMTMQASMNMAKFEQKIDSRTEGLEGMMMAAAMTGSRMQKMIDDRTQSMEGMLMASAHSTSKQVQLMQSIAPSPDVPRLTWGGDLGGWSGSDGEDDDEDEEPRAPPITLDTLCAKVEEVVAARGGGKDGKPLLIGIAGIPGAGKSTMTAELAEALRGREGAAAMGPVTVMPMDGFHLPRSALDAMADPQTAHARRGAPFTFDPSSFCTCLEGVRAALTNGKDASVPTFDHKAGDPVEGGLTIPGGTKVVLVEGNYVLLGRLGQALKDPEWKDWEPLQSVLDETWFLSCSVDVAMERVAVRNMSNPGWEELSLAEARQRVTDNDRVNAMLVAHSGKHADFFFEMPIDGGDSPSSLGGQEKARAAAEAERNKPAPAPIQPTVSTDDDGTTQMLQFQAQKIVALTREKHALEAEVRKLGGSRERTASTGITESQSAGAMGGAGSDGLSEGMPPPMSPT